MACWGRPTELFKVLNGVMRQTAGRILLNGQKRGAARFRQRMALGMALEPGRQAGGGLLKM